MTTERTVTTLTPYLAVGNARRAIEWYVEIFGAQPVGEPVVMSDDRIGHAELVIDGAALYLSDEYPELGVRSPVGYGGSPVSLVIVVPDADATFAAAVEAGATVERPVADLDHGHRAGWLTDPFGHRWNVSTPLAP